MVHKKANAPQRTQHTESRIRKLILLITLIFLWLFILSVQCSRLICATYTFLNAATKKHTHTHNAKKWMRSQSQRRKVRLMNIKRTQQQSFWAGKKQNNNKKGTHRIYNKYKKKHAMTTYTIPTSLL